MKNPLRKNAIRLLICFHLVQYANTEFMSQMTWVYSQPSQISKMETFAKIVRG